MDPVSAIGLAAGIAQLIDSVAHTISYIKDVKNASKERAQILQEAASLLGLLTTLKYKVEYADTTDPWFVHVRSLGGPGGPLEQCENGLEELAKKIKPDMGVKSLGKRLLWTLDKSQVKRMLDMIERLKTLISIALQEDNFALSLAIKDGITELGASVNSISDSIAQLGIGHKQVADRLLDEKEQAAVDWLSSLNFASKQVDTLSMHEEGTGKWFLEEEIFKTWCEGDYRVLWCQGIPGAGKTVLTAIAVNHLQNTIFSSGDAVTVFIYINYKEQDGQTVAKTIGSILQQVVQRKTRVSIDIMTLYELHLKTRTRPAVGELTRLIHAEIDGLSKAFILVDAMDECAEANGVRLDFLQQLRDLLQHPKIRLMITSRYMNGIKESFSNVLELEIMASDRDLRRYIEARIPKEPRLARHVKGDRALQELIINTLAANAKGMFLLASLHLDVLAKKQSKKDARLALANLPEKLSDTYEEVMKRICSQDIDDARLAKRILSWLSYALRPLTVTELQTALAIEPGTTVLDEEALVPEDLLVSVCAGLVTIDRGSDVIRLVHYTTQQYLSAVRRQELPWTDADIVVCCLTYLLFDVFATTAYRSTRDWKQMKFTYAADKWMFHANRLSKVDPVIQSLLLRLFPRFARNATINVVT